MLRHVAVLVVSSVVLLGAGSGDPWLRMRPMNDSFVVSVPNVMQRHEDVTTVPWGRQSTVIYQVEKGFGSYAVVYAEYPREFIEAVDLQKLFDAQQANIVPGTRADVLSVQPIQKHARTAREVVFHSDDEKRLNIAQIVLSGRRLYTLLGTTVRPGLEDKEIRRFLDSFEFR